MSVCVVVGRYMCAVCAKAAGSAGTGYRGSEGRQVAGSAMQAVHSICAEKQQNQNLQEK